ncbi:MAG: intraflagellar transport protein [Trebouxia sp. A1-2]|nr:MAG: intraflagellar transport protein [Trebouxia sp. A1-2]
MGWREDDLSGLPPLLPRPPDGSELVTGIGSRVLVYETTAGDLLHSLRGHKDAVYCVAYSHDSKRFASGGADKTVIIWTSKAEGVVKYNHNDSVQVLAYNPLSQQLASGTASDFGLWSPELKHVAKHKVSSKVVSLAWTIDGQFLALGLYDGQISIRSRVGEETITIQRNAPVWTLSWSPDKYIPPQVYNLFGRDQSDVLSVGCWDGTLSHYSLSGEPVGAERQLGFDPCCVSYMPSGEFICIGGTDCKATLCTSDGTMLSTLATRGGWVWCVSGHPKKNFVAVGSEDGSIAVEHMTDVVIQHLTTEQKVRIQCNDYVKKLAVYKDCLAVQLPKRITVYQLKAGADATDMRYKPVNVIEQELECNLLVVTAHHLTLCQDGQVVTIYVDNPFPMPVVKHHTSIRCLDLSSSRGKLAVVDDNNTVQVYSMQSKALLSQDKNANSVAWNTEFEDMLCFSGGGKLSTKTASFPLHQQKMQGFVVGFKGSQVFCLHYNSMQALEVPQSASMQGYLAAQDWQNAYKAACLGVPDVQWSALGHAALQALQLEVASKAFGRIADTRYLRLLHQVEQARKAGQPAAILMADVLAYQGRYQEAAHAYAQAGAVHRAMDMFSDLRQFAEAKAWAEEWERTKDSEMVSIPSAGRSPGQAGPVSQSLVQRQAEWNEEMKDFQAAADMYLQAKKFDKAVAIMGRNHWWDKLNQVVGQLQGQEPAEKTALAMCAAFFRRAGQTQFAKEAYVKLQDHQALAELAVEAERWEEACQLATDHPDLAQTVCLPWAEWLVARGSFQEARLAYRQAGRWQESERILQQLIDNAVTQHQYSLAASLHHQLAMEAVDEAPSTSGADADDDRLARHAQLHQQAELYYAYDMMYKSTTCPFRTVFATTLFNAACFLLMHLPQEGTRKLPGISRAVVLHVCAQQAQQVQAFKLARWAHTQLQTLRLPPSWQDSIDLAAVQLRGSPFTDAEEVLPTCYRCGSSNPLVNAQGDRCNTCGNGVVRSFLTFEPLPLLQFQVASHISDDQAAALLEQDPEPHTSQGGLGATPEGGADVLQIEDSGDALDIDLDDPFQAQMLDISQPIVADEAMLKLLKQQEVIIRPGKQGAQRCQYFKVMDPSTPICLAPCGHFYEEDEYEMHVLEHGSAPFCSS